MENLYLVVKPQGQDDYENVWIDGRLTILRTHSTIIKQCWAANDAGTDVFVHLASTNQVIAQVEIKQIREDIEPPEVYLMDWREMKQQAPGHPYGRGFYWAQHNPS
ncbi:hypothetical protein [Melittangium boletus]|uniref:hypothetical protein n=1 Tax=Melittangium boletus TaxID=83453 RepID=UPI003DA442C2